MLDTLRNVLTKYLKCHTGNTFAEHEKHTFFATRTHLLDHTNTRTHTQ